MNIHMLHDILVWEEKGGTMIATRIFCFLLLMLPFVACSDDDNTAPALPQPSGLVATGALGRITLAWSGTNGGGMEGYRIYRSQNGTDYTLLTNVTGTGWTNQLPADGTADGIYYHYRITTFKSNTESLPSAAVRQMHGTRLPALYAETTQYLTESGSSPYVVEGTSFIKHTLNIAAGTKLYLLPGSTLIILTNRNLDCNGTIQSLGEPGNPVTITCKKDDGSEPGSIGFRPQFYNTSPAWDPLTRTGSILQHTLVTNIYNYISFHS